MPRPQKNRIVKQPPPYASFKPSGVARRDLQQIFLSLDEYEAIRLADFLQMEHENASLEMGISRSTFSRLLEKARNKVSCFLIKGRELCISGGSVHFKNNIIRCETCNDTFNTGFEKEINFCPKCGSKDLQDLAGEYGHGICCQQYGQENKQ